MHQSTRNLCRKIFIYFDHPWGKTVAGSRPHGLRSHAGISGVASCLRKYTNSSVDWMRNGQSRVFQYNYKYNFMYKNQNIIVLHCFLHVLLCMCAKKYNQMHGTPWYHGRSCGRKVAMNCWQSEFSTIGLRPHGACTDFTAKFAKLKLADESFVLPQEAHLTSQCWDLPALQVALYFSRKKREGRGQFQSGYGLTGLRKHV